MRVYELSKQLGMTNKEMLDSLHKAGFEVQTHMSTLSQEAIDFFTKKAKAASAPVAQPAAPSSPVSKSSEPKEHLAQPVQQPAPTKKVGEPLHQGPVAPKSVKQQPAVAQPFMQRSVQPSPVIKKEEPQELILEAMTVGDFALKAKISVSDLILTLLKQGIVYAKNQLLPIKTVELLAKLYQLPFVAPSSGKSAVTSLQKPTMQGTYTRLPVVVVIGHVDHGKTTLLDFIRKTKVAAREHGGITQHLGAYQVATPQGNLVFLDTPGHAAFSMMRARGVRAADIAVLVIAADDGVMPQTVEAIKHAQTIQIPIIVAINKIDKVGPTHIEAIKRDLAQYNLIPEEWGGSTIIVPISAKTGKGIDQLLEMIVLQAHMMELNTTETGPAKGFILESKLEKGRGAVATVIIHEGSIAVGDYFVAGKSQGRVNSLMDSFGHTMKNVGPSIPVQIAGFELLPDVGDLFEVVPFEKFRQAKAQKSENEETTARKTGQADSTIILKVDSNSSKEALLGAIAQLEKTHAANIHVVHSAVGDINESDVLLAQTTHALIYGFHVKTESNAAVLAQRSQVTIRLFHVIYHLLDDVALLCKKEVQPNLVATKIGEATVIRVFDIKNVGVIAGAIVKEGRLSRAGRMVVWRGRQKMGEGSIKSLERERKSVKEVHTGFECAFLVEGFQDWMVDDRVECYLDLPAGTK